MKLHVLGSSSSGNGYMLENDTEALVIECGVSLKEVKKAIDFNISKIVGAIVSHEHGDHAKYVNEFLNARINVHLSAGTVHKIKITTMRIPHFEEAGCSFRAGGFKILPFEVKHDAADPLGFLIQHAEIGTMLFATDTYYLPYCFANLTNIMIECNYRKDLLDANIKAGRVPEALRARTLESHMSFDTCKEALLANDLSRVNNIILLHLSDGNSNAEEFQKDIQIATGKTVWVADKGMTINLNRIPF